METYASLVNNGDLNVQMNSTESNTDIAKPYFPTDNSSTYANHDEFLIVRIDALLIFIENGFVALCLCKERRKFTKKEFWLQLISLIINDLFVSVSLFLWSFINHDIFDKSFIGCAVLTVCVMVSQMALLINVLSICIYRLLFLVCTDRYRFGWKGKTTVKQILLIYMFSFLYIILPIFIWGKYENHIEYCSPENLFDTGLHNTFIFIGTGLLVPLIVLNALYGLTFHLLRRQLRKRNRYVHVCRNFQLFDRFTSSQHYKCQTDDSKGNNYNGCNRTAANSRRTLTGDRRNVRRDNPSGRTDYQSKCDKSHSSHRHSFISNAFDTNLSEKPWSSADDSSSKSFNQCYNSVGSDVGKTCEQDSATYKEKHSSRSVSTPNDCMFKTEPSSINDNEPYWCKQSTSNRATVQRTESSDSDILTQRNEKQDTCQAVDVQTMLASRLGSKRRMSKTRQRQVSNTLLPGGNSSREIQKQSLLLIGLILLLIDITVIPFIVYLITEKLLEPILIPEIVREILCLLVMNNSLLNPWIYAIQSKEVRRAIMHNFRISQRCVYSCKVRD